MGVLDKFEKGVERVVSTAFAKAFKSEVKPVELASALRREVDDRAAVVGRDRTVVPNEFTIELSAVVQEHAGRAMARVMSIVSSLFILVPIIAPAFGQAVLSVASWRMIFWLLVLVAVVDVLWFGLRQPETLPPERRTRPWPT